MTDETERTGTRFRVRDGFGVAAFVLALLAAAAVLLLVTGLWKRFVRETAPVLMDLPGGSWTVGAVLGLVSVAGGAGVLRFSSGSRARTTSLRALQAAGSAVCWTTALGPLLYLLYALPGRNCRSYGSRCAYIPGTGSALSAYVISAALVGWALYRWSSAAGEAQAAGERARKRKLRKKGKGKSRAARQR
ncbi:hypothetical protein [Streptomyces sp. NBC_00005]|uniref:hypothetical protein n=1 Tax=Streptomyces sp. NBC_00005 TaxID=2903609 RepID=UPI003244EDD8